MKFPKNIILSNQYTSGGKYVIKGTLVPYAGYYFVMHDKAFTGKEPDRTSQALEKLTDALAKNALKNAKNALKKHNFNTTIDSNEFEETTRYFAKRPLESPIRISEIDKETFDSIQYDPQYQSISIRWNTIRDNSKVIQQADDKFSGLKLFLSSE